MIDLLQKSGLSLYESKIYLVLLEYRQLNAKQIAEKSNVPQTAVYPNLSLLIEKGFIQQQQGKVRYFQSLPPTLTIPNYINQKQKELHHLQETLIHQAKEKLHSKELQIEKEVLSITKGKELSIALYHDTLARCQKSFYILGWHFETIGDKYLFLDEFKKAIKRKVDVRILITGSPNKKWSIVNAYQSAGIKLKYLPLDNFSLFIADSTECKITLKDKQLPERSNIHIHDPSLSKALETYFLTQWNEAVLLKPKES